METQIPQNATRRAVFDDVAHEYDAVRPGYPAALIEDIVALAALPPGGRILEIGPGTGQATLPFAQRGYQMICVELGKHLAALAAQKCAPFPNVRIIRSAWKDWQPDSAPFDLVMSATVWHWLPRETSYAKATRVLADTGALATFSNEHPFPATGFFADVQRVYRQVVPEWSDPSTAPPLAVSVEKRRAEIDSTQLFEPVQVRRYPCSHTYSAHEYVRLLDTYSDHHGLPPTRRAQLRHGIQAYIEEHYGGSVTKHYEAVLFLAKKRA